MTPADLRTICNLIGGRNKLAGLLHTHPGHLGKKLSGKVGITYRDELAIRQVLDRLLRDVKACEKPVL